MSHTPHELAEDFPESIELMRNLSQTNAHFQRLADEYHTVNRAIHRAETNIEPMDQFAEEGMRKTRMRLKDEIASILAAAS